MRQLLGPRTAFTEVAALHLLLLALQGVNSYCSILLCLSPKASCRWYVESLEVERLYCYWVSVSTMLVLSLFDLLFVQRFSAKRIC